MKKLIIISLALLIGFGSFAQKRKKSKNQDTDITLDVAKIKKALRYADYETAISSLYDVIQKEGETSTYLDSLAYLYFSTGRYASCALVTKDVLDKDESKANMLELRAVSLSNLGNTVEAIDAYQKLVPLTKNIHHYYELALLQYSIKRLAEAAISIKNAEAIEATEKDFVNIPLDKNQAQKVPIMAAIYNLHGLIAYDLDKTNTEAPKQAFQKALEIFPDFVLAQNNMKAMEQPKEDKKSLAPTEEKKK
jgi:tetratricopeptide (TPR) repeat protein